MDHVQQQPIDPSCRQRVSPCHMSFLTSFSVPVSMADAQRFRRGIGTDDKPSTCPCNVDNLMRSTHSTEERKSRASSMNTLQESSCRISFFFFPPLTVTLFFCPSHVQLTGTDTLHTLPDQFGFDNNWIEWPSNTKHLIGFCFNELFNGLRTTYAVLGCWPNSQFHRAGSLDWTLQYISFR